MSEHSHHHHHHHPATCAHSHVSAHSGPHDHHGHHDHGHSHDFAQANMNYFNEEYAQKFDVMPEAVEAAQRISQAMLKAHLFDEESTTVLDYACGTGLISRELAPYTKSIVGVDISQPMINQYNLRVSNQGVTPEEMKAVCVNLQGQEGELDGAKFDVVVCASSYHHFASIGDTTRVLAFFLKPGGSLLVADIAKTDTGSTLFPEEAAHVVPHRAGFTKEEFQDAFKAAGLDLVSFDVVTTARLRGQEMDIFLAKGVKPS